MCTVQDVTPAVMAIYSTVNYPMPNIQREHSLEVLQDWGCSWMWKDLTIIGDDNRIFDTIK